MATGGGRMTDHGHPLLFGTFLTPVADDPERVVVLAQLTEQAGLDLVTVQDHPYQARFLDTWTLLSVIAARTSAVRVAPNVANLPLRPPAVLARSVATLDLLSGGRVELGLGAGAFWEAITAMGVARLTPAESVTALEEGIEVIRAMWDTSRRSVQVEGRHHRVKGVHPGPAPAHDVGIWLGAYKTRMLRLTGRTADGWLPSSAYADPSQLPAMSRTLDEAAVDAGRDPAEVRRLYNVAGRFQPRGDGFLQGPPAMWAEQLAELALTVGISGFVMAGDDPDDIRRFAAEVAPAVRELVAAERLGQPAAGVGSAAAAPSGPAQPTGLRVTPTPDDGTRLTGERLWDEASRPSVPPPDPDRTYTPHEEASGRHLVDVHAHLRQELSRLRELVAQVTAGRLDTAAARSHIATMTIRQNDWTVGAYCASYCRVVTVHHSLEDRSMFPHLRRADPRLAPVIERLEEEHHVIHDVLERVDRALVAFVGAADGARRLQHAVDLVSDVLLSHLSYEERELVEPLARLGYG
jgi:alkanesulfonate monooxygenase SsuD/methylene tetrahydromethanopterin reductase-like flavin-dependent oxidoreductase (luciferase family)/hemerythrin-like domain-containing protein